MSGHAYLPPSSADCWGACALWPTMNQRYPEAGDDPAAAEGIAAHWVNVEALYGRTPAEGTRAPNGVAVTDEMLDGAELWVDTVGPLPMVGDARVEQTLRGQRVHDSLNWGTPDLWGLWGAPTGPVLRVLDYKFGHGYVGAFENLQLVNYAALVLDEMGVDGHSDQTLEVELTVVQPRNFHPSGPVRTWRVGKASNLRGYVNKLRAAADRATMPDPQGTVGPQCKHCPGRHACEALQRNSLAAVDYAGGSASIDLPPAALGAELRTVRRALALLEARATGLEAQALAVIKRGENVPHWSVEQGKGRERWARPLPEVVAIGAAMGFELGKPDAVTPNQARKLGMPPELVAAFAEVPTGAVKLVPDDGSKARAAFAAN